jgi:4-amino-4-deoxy-L-arabinose transferase-like glycosyltransferase
MLLVLSMLAGWRYSVRGLLHLGILLTTGLAMSGLLMAVWFGFGSSVLGLANRRALQIPDLLVYGTAIGMGVLALLVLAAGALRLLYPWAAALMCLAGIALAVRTVLADRARYLGAWQTSRAGLSRARLSPWYLAVAALIALNLAYPLLTNALVPPVLYDEAAYHLAIPKIYILQHSITYIPFIPYANWPLGTEMLFTVGLLLGSETLVHMITWNALILTCGGLWLCGRRYFGPLGAALSVLIFTAMPMVGTEAGTGLVELPLALFTALAVFAFLRWIEQRETSWFLLSAISSGLAASVKFNGAVTAALMACLFALADVLVHRRSILTSIKALIVYGLVAFAVVLPWYLKAFLQTGNPLWPFFLNVLGGKNWDTLGNEYLFGYIRSINLPATLPNWITAWWQMTGIPPGFDLGWYFVVLLPLALAAIIFGTGARKRTLTWLALSALALYTAWFFETHQIRFLLPAAPVFALLMASGLTWVIELGPRPWRIAVLAGVLVAFLATDSIFTPYVHDQLAARRALLLGTETRDTFLAQHVKGYSTFLYANQHLPPDSRVLLSLYESRGYYLDRDYVWSNPISSRYIKLENFADAAALHQFLKEMKYTHLLFTPNYIEEFMYIRYGPKYAQLITDLLQQYGQVQFATPDLSLYVLK